MLRGGWKERKGARSALKKGTQVRGKEGRSDGGRKDVGRRSKKGGGDHIISEIYMHSTVT